MRHGVFIAAILSLLLAVPVEAAIVQAFVDKNQAAVGESIALSVSVKGGKGEVDVTGIENFRVMGSGTSNSIQIINGKTSREQIHQYTLLPLKAGIFTIPPLPVTVDGVSTRTQPITITVTRRPAADSTARDVFVAGEVSDPSPFEGQQIRYTFRFYKAIQVLDTRFRPPEFKGFDAKQIEEQKTATVTVNGRRYSVVELNYILVPNEPGEFVIDPAILQCSVAKPRSRRSPFPGFDNFFNRTETEIRNLQTEPLTVRVRSLPEPEPGTRFSGLVGTFDIEANLENNKLKAGDSTTVAVTIRGEGNVMDAAQPELTVPSDVKTYSDQPEEKINVGENGYEGEKIFRTALVALTPGRYRIDPLSLTYFDIKTGSYQTKTTRPIELEVTASETAPKAPDSLVASPPSKASPKNRVEFVGRDILPLKEALDSLSSQRRLSVLVFIALLCLPILVFILSLAIIRLSAKDTRPAAIMSRRSKTALKKAVNAEIENAEFLSLLYNAMISAVFANCGRTGESLTRREAEDLLTANGWDSESAEAIASLIEKIESFNYSGEPLTEPRRIDLLNQTGKLVKRLLP